MQVITFTRVPISQRQSSCKTRCTRSEHSQLLESKIREGIWPLIITITTWTQSSHGTKVRATLRLKSSSRAAEEPPPRLSNNRAMQQSLIIWLAKRLGRGEILGTMEQQMAKLPTYWVILRARSASLRQMAAPIQTPVKALAVYAGLKWDRCLLVSNSSLWLL